MTAPAIPLRQLVIGDLDHEFAITRRVLERVPDEHLDWKPHEKSMSMGQLATHIANIPFLAEQVFTQETFDIATAPRPAAPASSRAELLARFDGLVAKVKELAANVSDDALLSRWVFRRGDTVIFDAPRAAALRTFGISHIIHHRGQLSVYLRQVGTPVPGIYGPSADEPM